jgi:acetyltransferase-like isoleucine patch superfamily enzyme
VSLVSQSRSGAGILIGNDVVISRNVQVLSASHDYTKGIPFHPTDYKTRLTEIKDGCFVGQNVIILPGTILGRRCVVQAGSVLHGTYPDDSMIFANASRNFRELNRFEREANRHRDNN